MTTRRLLRIGATIAFTGLAVGYLVWKIDLHQTWATLEDANPWWFALACAIMIGPQLTCGRSSTRNLRGAGVPADA